MVDLVKSRLARPIAIAGIFRRSTIAECPKISLPILLLCSIYRYVVVKNGIDSLIVKLILA
jgi:hypothetical protein